MIDASDISPEDTIKILREWAFDGPFPTEEALARASKALPIIRAAAGVLSVRIDHDVMGGIAIYVGDGEAAWFSFMNEGGDSIVVAAKRGAFNSPWSEDAARRAIALLLPEVSP